MEKSSLKKVFFLLGGTMGEKINGGKVFKQKHLSTAPSSILSSFIKVGLIRLTAAISPLSLLLIFRRGSVRPSFRGSVGPSRGFFFNEPIMRENGRK